MSMEGFLKGLAIGLIAGGVTGILLAPKSGKETRKDITNYLDDFQDKLIGKIGDIKDFTKEKYGSVVDEVVEGYQKLNLDAGQKEEIKKELKNCFYKIKDVVKS